MSRRFQSGGFVPLVDRWRVAARSGQGFLMDSRDCASAVRVLEESWERELAAVRTIRTARWAWLGWFAVGVVVGLALPRILLMLAGLAHA